MSANLAKGQALVSELFAGLDNPGSEMPTDLKRYTFEHLYGDVWQGDDLELDERSLITCTVLVATAREHEQLYHFRAARNLGISRAKLEAMITHVAHYAGWPAAFGSLRVLDEVWNQMDDELESNLIQ